MGQYYMVVNKDKKQYLYPHKFGDGLKLLEFGMSAEGTMTGLAILLAESNGRGGGDLGSDNPIVGSWCGDRIVVAGDYADPAPDAPLDSETNKPMNLYDIANNQYEDISEKVLAAMQDDDYFLEEQEKAMKDKEQYTSDMKREAWAKAKAIRAKNSKTHPHKWRPVKQYTKETAYRPEEIGKYESLTYCLGCGQFRRVDEATGKVTEIRH